MKTTRFDQLVEQLESRSLRERALILLAAMAVVIGAVEVFWLAPQQALQR